jgi:hypothetical protein
VPGLDWPFWAAVVAAVAAAILLVLLRDASWFEGGAILERLENAFLVAMNIGFVALAAGVLKRLGAPIWAAIPLGAGAVALAYIWKTAVSGETLVEAMVLISILSLIAGLLFPVFEAARQKVRMRAEQRHRSTFRAPGPSAPRDNGAAAAPGRGQQRTETHERGPTSPAASGIGDR